MFAQSIQASMPTTHNRGSASAWLLGIQFQSIFCDMLFYSFEFLYIFLPTVCTVSYALARLPDSFQKLNLLWLIACSLFFYGWWGKTYVLLILASIIFNYSAGKYLRVVKHHWALICAVAINILLICYFKYLGFFTDIVNGLLGYDIQLGAVVLPLAISFFTFQQIAWLVDSYSGRAEKSDPDFVEYMLFVMFFPQLIAGPIVHYGEIIPQFRTKNLGKFQIENFAPGISIFIVGLFKKVVVADNIAPVANLIFDGAAWGQTYSIVDAWIGALAYTLQLYFDFSGYADMAIGLGLMLNIRLPVNFESPYKSCSIREFWHRWHMTLSRFLRSYVYIPLGGNRKGQIATYGFLLITMLLGGLWHGAGWTYVIWGGLHGAFLIINQLWSKYSPWVLPRVLSWLITFLAVLLAWVIFRSNNIDTAARVLTMMFSIESLPLFFGNSSVGFTAQLSVVPQGLMIVALASVLLLPNTRQLMRGKFIPIEYDRNVTSTGGIIHVRILDSICVSWSYPWLVFLTVLAGLSIYTLLDSSTIQEFIYFQF